VLCALCFALGNAAVSGQLLEFKGSKLRGRLDNPAADNLWRLGDDNGNGLIDENENAGPWIEIEGAFQEEQADAADDYIAPRGSADRYFVFGGPTGIYADVDGDGDQDLIGISVDFSGAYPIDLSPKPKPVAAWSYTHSSGMQLLHVLEFGQPPQDHAAVNDTLEIAYGMRFLNVADGLQTIDGRLSYPFGLLVDTTLDNHALGPQVRGDWARRRGKWQVQASAAAAIAYVNAEGRQRVQSSGAELIPGRLNRPVIFRLTQLTHQLNAHYFSPTVETGVRLSYELSPSLVCFARCDAMYFGNLRNAEHAVVWSLPDMGLADHGGRDVAIAVGTIGYEFRH